VTGFKIITNRKYKYVISGFCCKVDENCALLGYHTANNVNFLPTFQDNLLFPSSRDNLPVPPSWAIPWRWDPIHCPETLVKITTTHCVITQKSTVLRKYGLQSSGKWQGVRLVNSCWLF